MRLYTKDHAWFVAEGTRARVGISDFAQSELGDIAYVDLPAPGRRLERGEVACTVESLKSSSEIYSPVAGTVVEVNGQLATEERCGLVNSDPLGEGWLFLLELVEPVELEQFLAEEAYHAYVQGTNQVT
jgi:glycine cleavage system H protein